MLGTIFSLFFSCEDALAKAGIARLKQRRKDACFDFVKIVSPDNPIFPLFKAQLFTHLQLTVHVQIDHLQPYHLILIVSRIL